MAKSGKATGLHPVMRWFKSSYALHFMGHDIAQAGSCEAAAPYALGGQPLALRVEGMSHLLEAR